MVQTWTHGIDNTHIIDLDSWYRIGAPESHKYERAECCPYAGFSKLNIDFSKAECGFQRNCMVFFFRIYASEFVRSAF